MKTKPRQFEMNWPDPEPLALVPETTLDGDRIKREREQLAADREHNDSKQSQMIKE